ncbi:MAG: hypothetical protein H7X80_06360, partial [bacterium]|nr:hypothetical protein [Candidatus Kapabacteria bacterium]
MPRALRYFVNDAADNRISNDEWKKIAQLQHWYNSEFIWSCDRLAIKRFIIFPNYEAMPEMPYRTAKYHFRKRFLSKKIELKDEIAAVKAMEEEGLFSVRWGGIRDNSIASGITRTADNEFNAYLLCEFLLKCSTIARESTFCVEDEGRFVMPGRAMFRDGAIMINRDDLYPDGGDIPLDIPQVFSVVNPAKYDEHPRFEQSVEDFDDLDDDELHAVSQKFGVLGFAPNYDSAWGDNEGLNLQQR